MAVMRTVRRVTATTGVTPATDVSLLDNDLARAGMDEEGPESSPTEEDDLHNAHRKGSFQHRARLVYLVGERVVGASTVLAKGAE